MIQVGKKQILKVDSTDSSGFYLLCEENFEAFMPGTLAPKGLKVGESIEVFVFIDSKGDEIATSHMPLAEVDDFACLKVKEVTHFGAFLDWGLPKDLLVPSKMQKSRMQVGEIRLVKILKEENSNKIYGTEKIGPHIESMSVPLRTKQSVRLVPFRKTDLGYKVLVESKYLGMIYHNEIFSEVELGKEYQGTVKWVREDGLVDTLISKVGFEAAKDNSQILLSALQKAGGRLELWDKSSPEEIKKALGMSKKSFKSAVGILYKKRLIKLEEGAIVLV